MHCPGGNATDPICCGKPQDHVCGTFNNFLAHPKIRIYFSKGKQAELKAPRLISDVQLMF